MNDSLTPNLRLIGRYAVLRELKRDRASVTYIAMDPVMHREVVLKAVQLPPPATQGDSNEAQISTLEAAFVRQAQAAGKLHHPHIVTVFDAGRVHHVAYLAIERVAGRPLHELLAGGWRPEFIHCASITARVADALEYAHGQGVGHGHLGPQHVVLQADGSPKIEGFGGWIDSGAGGEEALAHTERLLPYFQNELTEEARRKDMRAIGVLLHMLLTGKAPQRESETRFKSVLALRADIPDPLARLVDETLQADGPTSYRTAADLRDALTAFLWNERKAHVAPGTIGIPLAAPPAERPIDPAAAQFPRSSAAANLRTMLPPSRAGTSPGAAPAPTITRAISAETTPPARPASQPDTPPAAANLLPPADVPPATPGASTGSVSTAALDFGQLLVRRVREILVVHRLAVAAFVGLVAIGIVIGIVLARLAGSAPTATPEAKAPVLAPRPATGIVILEIVPWGEVLVDNKPVGVAPPLSQLTLPVGTHRVEIRHGDKPAVAAEVTVDPAQPQRVRHTFD